MLSNILDRIAFWSIFLVVALLPIFFIPFTKIPVEVSKSLLVIVGLSVSIVSWSAARFSDGKILVPKSNIILSGLLVVLATLLSSVFSHNHVVSFFGVMFDVGTFWFVLTGFFLMLFLSLIVRTKRQSKIFLFGILTSVFLLLFFQVIRYFAPSIFSFGILSSKVENLFGTWNSFGYIAGLSIVASLFVLESLSLDKRLRIFIYVSILLSLFTVAAVNSVTIWELVGIFSLFIFVYKLASSTNLDGGMRKDSFPVHALVVVIISLLFFLSGRFIGNLLPSLLGLSNIEVSPALSTTLTVGKSSLMHDPFFGAGANRFNEIWSLWKPKIINNTQFWDTAFNSGFGFLPTAAINTGFFGVLSWLVFLGCVIYLGVKTLFENFKSKENSITVLYFIISVFMLTACFFYSFGISGVMLLFALTGLFIATRSIDAEGRVYELNFLSDPRKSFFSIIFLVVFMLGTVGLSFKFIEKFASVSYFNKALAAKDVQEAQNSIDKAISLHQSDLYFRTASQIELANLSILSQKNNLTDQDKADLQTSFNRALDSANRAIAYNNKNYTNYQMLGIVYSTVSRLGVEGAADQAINSYIEASKLNPLNPGIVLAIANQYVAINKNTEARKYAMNSLSLAPNYIDALVLLSRIEHNLGNLDKSVEYAEKARSLDPNNKALGNYTEGLKTSSESSQPEDSSVSKESSKPAKKQ